MTISPRTRELFRAGAQLALDPPAEWLAELDGAVLGSTGMRAEIAEDPVLSEGLRRTNRSNLVFWAEANVRAPGEPVPANDGGEPLAIARDLVRRGLDASALDAYRAGQSTAIRLWTRLVAELTDDIGELRDLLDVSLLSITDFVDRTVSFIAERIEQEREELSGGALGERLGVVRLLLEGAPIRPSQAETRLRYRLTGQHTAAVCWVADPAVDAGQLDTAGEAVAACALEPVPLVVVATAASRWVWVHGAVDRERLDVELRSLPAVRLALGSTRDGVEGFRRSHLDALVAQRLLVRARARFAVHDEVELAALLGAEAEAADRFVERVLGGLATAAPEVQDTVRAYLAAGGSVAGAAERTYAHRNTVLRRMARAQELLPQPLERCFVDVGAALEVLRWRPLPP